MKCWDCAYLGPCQIYGKPCEKFKLYKYMSINKIIKITGISSRTLYRWQQRGLKYLLKKIRSRMDDKTYTEYYEEIKDYFITKEKDK